MNGLQAIRIEGGIVPPTLFQHLQAGDIGDAASRTPLSYDIAGRLSIRDAANRSWTYLVGAWEAWRDVQGREPGGFSSTNAAVVRERWLLVLMQELGYGRLSARSGGITIDDHPYPVSHLWQQVPIHLVGPGVDLDRRHAGVAGATRAPQAMVQELLNRTDESLWAIVSNGLHLRLLRDSTALAGSAFIEFDLEAMFDGELFAEFLLLWQTCHRSRLEPRTDGDGAPTVTECWLEGWRADSVKAGARALDNLRAGVEAALTHLGTGFLAHPANTGLRTALSLGALRTDDYHRHLLRLVYRLLFLFVTEDRGVLLDPGATSIARQRYTDYLSTRRLRNQARERRGSAAYADLWQAQRLVLHALGGNGQPGLALPALGGLFDPEDGQGDPLLDAELANSTFLAAIRDLAWLTTDSQRLQPVDYRNLGAEELGSVYESLLELIPRVYVDEHRFALEHLSGNERKTTGSYYTPPGLVSALLDTALNPVIDDAVAEAATTEDAERRLLALSICDPACGSGHLLVAAARRIAQRVAALRSGEDEPTPADVRHALRDVVGRCVYGVDINPLAAELAKVSLWLEAIEPGKALGFLDARIRVGNSLIGTTPALLAAGVPDEAFKALEGDDKQVAAQARKRNSAERGAFGQVQDQFDLDLSSSPTHTLAQARIGLLSLQDDAAAVRAQARRWREYEHSATYLDRKTPADAWVAAFVWPLRPTTARSTESVALHSVQPPTSAIVRRLAEEPHAAGLAPVRVKVEELSAEYRFFHWHLEFPEVFDQVYGEPSAEGWTGGFDCTIGNPPWERVKLQEQEFFAARDPEIAMAPNAAARRSLIAALATSESAADRALHTDFLEARRRAEGESSILRTSGRYPLAGRGDVNTYAVFAELFRTLSGPRGQSGIIVPTGIATDATTQHFFKDIVEARSLAALFDYENAAPIFEGVHRSYKLCLLTMLGRARRADAATFAFFLHDPLDIDASRFALTPAEITLLSPNTGTLPTFRSRRDVELTLAIHRRVPILVREGDPKGNPWGVAFLAMFHLSNDSELFHGREQLHHDGWTELGNAFEKRPLGMDESIRMLPLYEAKMLNAYDHRDADVVKSATASKRQNQPRYLSDQDHRDPWRFAMPSSWILESKLPHVESDWLAGFSNVTSATNERTILASALPLRPVGNTYPLVMCENRHLLLAMLNSFVVDYGARQKVAGLHLTNGHIKQLPILTPEVLQSSTLFGASDLEHWITERVLELQWTAYDLASFARDLGDHGQPFVWDVERRRLLRAELDAAFFHLYGVDRDDVDYILETFPIVKRKDLATYGEYRTKRLILEVFDAMEEATETGAEYQSILDPPPGQGPRHPAESPHGH